MALDPKQLCQQAVSSGSWDTSYTVPASTAVILQTMDICNTTAGSLDLRICLVPSGGSPGTDNAIMYDMSIPAHATVTWMGNQVLETAGDTIQMYASGAGLTVTASGLERT